MLQSFLTRSLQPERLEKFDQRTKLFVVGVRFKEMQESLGWFPEYFVTRLRIRSNESDYVREKCIDLDSVYEWYVIPRVLLTFFFLGSATLRRLLKYRPSQKAWKNTDFLYGGYINFETPCI